MRAIIFLCLVFFKITSLFATFEGAFPNEEEPEIFQQVDVITGQLALSMQDAAVQGVAAFPLTKTYDRQVEVEGKGRLLKDVRGGWVVEGGAEMLPHLRLTLLEGKKVREQKISLAEPSGALYTYEYNRTLSKERPVYTAVREKGPRLSHESQQLELRGGEIHLKLPKGGKRVYRKNSSTEYLAAFEKLPSGHKLVYSYDEEGRVDAVSLKNPKETETYSWVCFHHKEGANTLDVKTFPGRDERYSAFVETAKEKRAVSHMRWHGEREVDIVYDGSGKIIRLESPLSGSKGSKSLAEFIYYEHFTDVKNSEGLLTRYHHSQGCISEIEYFDAEGLFHAGMKLLWKKGQLQAKVFYGKKGPVLSKTLIYDTRGNIIEETLYGKITGEETESFILKNDGSLKGATSVCKKYRYDADGNCIEEKAGSLVYHYHYLTGTNLITEKTLSFDGGIQSRQIFSYDDDHLLIEEKTEKGGRVELKQYVNDIQKGLPISCKDSYLTQDKKQYLPLKETRYVYNEQLQLIEEKVFDAKGSLYFEASMEYDNQGRLIKKKIPCAPEETYSYDMQGCLKEVSQGGAVVASHSCDESGCIQLPKEQSQVTFTEYDAFSRCEERGFSSFENAEEFSYDLLGNISSYKTPWGGKVLVEYSAFRKPIKMVAPDGAITLYRYNLQGSIVQIIYPDETKEERELDALERITSKKLFGKAGLLLKEERWVYSVSHLLMYEDAKGLQTIYTYDGAGRKIEEDKGGRKTFYSYDAFGFLCSVDTGVVAYVEERGKEGLIISSFEKRNGKELCRTNFSYDEKGRVILKEKKTPEGVFKEFFSYDDEEQKTSYKNSYGETQAILKRGNSVEITGPFGEKSIEIKDLFGRVLSKEKVDTKGNILSKEAFFYGPTGQVSKRVAYIYADGKSKGTFTVEFVYDEKRQLVAQVEEGSRKTAFAYDQMGRLISKELPSGISLTYSYSDLGYLTGVKSSDGSIDYLYEYSRAGEVTACKDIKSGKAVRREYNLFGELIKEEMASGLVMEFSYDAFGRKEKTILPDRSSIEYLYDGGSLAFVIRKDKEGKELYRHSYDAHDLQGRPSLETLIFGVDQVVTKRDSLGRPTLIQGEKFHLSGSYKKGGFLEEIKSSFFGKATYQYDLLGQLVEEEGFDSLGNIKKGDISPLNEVLAWNGEQLSYDVNGNLIHRDSGEDAVAYTYDPLGRLTSIADEDGITTYSYDPLSRLYEKKDKEVESFFYDGGEEIGLTNEKGEVKELKVLGGYHPIAIEVQGEVFAPIFDFSGNTIALLNTEGKVEEAYETDPFGKGEKAAYKNPWRLSCKRHDKELVFFGCRFYDAALKRFITPDPSGFTDGLNLYTYVLNNPLKYFDPFGLSSHRHHEFLLEVSIDAIQRAKGDGYLIECHGKTQMGKVDCYISCGFFDQLNYTEEEMQLGTINLFDHLHELLPSEGKEVGLITLGNGMNTTLEEFEEMGFSVMRRLHEGTLFIGLLTPSGGFFSDLARSAMERGSLVTPIIAKTAEFMRAMVQKIEQINPELIWLDIRHSEGGVIGKRAIEMLHNTQRRVLQRQLCSFTMGSAMPMPNDYGLHVHNVYSTADYFTGHFGVFLPEAYNVELLPSTVEFSDRIGWFADHAFIGSTYQEALDKSISSFREWYGFYNPIAN